MKILSSTRESFVFFSCLIATDFDSLVSMFVFF